MRKGLQFQEHGLDDMFESLQKCKYFYEKCILCNKSAPSIIVGVLLVMICVQFKKVVR